MPRRKSPCHPAGRGRPPGSGPCFLSSLRPGRVLRVEGRREHCVARYLAVLWIAALLGLASPASSADQRQTAEYDVEIAGVEDSGLREALQAASELVSLKDRPPPDIARLRRRAEADMERLRQVLRAQGYYAGDVRFHIDDGTTGPAKVVVEVRPGAPYRLESYRVLAAGREGETIAIQPETVGVELDSIAKSETILRSEPRLLAVLGERSFPLARIADRRVVVDHAKRTMRVEITVDPGPEAQFGATRLEGLESVDPSFVRRQILWSEGEPFDVGLLTKTRDRLRETELFASVTVAHDRQVAADGALPVTISVTERERRSVGLGASYSTSEGVLGKVFWEHRNLFGSGERLRLRAEGGEIRYGLFGDLRFPDIGMRDQNLIFEVHASEERPDGFRSAEIGTTGRIERRFGRSYWGSAGLGLERADIEDNDNDGVFTLASLPLSIKRDTSDSLLDPGRGSRAVLGLTPYHGIFGTDVDFLVTRLSDAIYYSILPDKEVVAAGWFRIGSIVGASTPEIPANKRLYAGGGGSIRGYGLNAIGPLDAENDPIGGRSSTEFGLELRWRAFETIGLVGFVEAGGVYDDPLPEWGQDLQWGAGVGVRYYSAIGPIRLDFAVPLNRRNAVDDAFAILVSVGQAF